MRGDLSRLSHTNNPEFIPDPAGLANLYYRRSIRLGYSAFRMVENSSRLTVVKMMS